MPSTQTVMPPPPFGIDPTINSQSPHGKWLQQVQGQNPLRTVNTSAGSYTENPPPAGQQGNSGINNTGQTITYKKTSSDGNTFTLAGNQNGPLPEGPLTLTTQYASIQIKSDGSNWWKL